MSRVGPVRLLTSSLIHKVLLLVCKRRTFGGGCEGVSVGCIRFSVLMTAEEPENSP